MVRGGGVSEYSGGSDLASVDGGGGGGGGGWVGAPHIWQLALTTGYANDLTLAFTQQATASCGGHRHAYVTG